MPADNTGQNIRRTLLVLKTISTFKGQWFNLTQLAERTGLAKSTTHRFIAVFVEEDILEKSEVVFGRYRHKRPNS